MLMYQIFTFVLDIFVLMLSDSFFQVVFFLPVAVCFFLWLCAIIKRGMSS